MESKQQDTEVSALYGIDASTIDSKGRVSFGKKKSEVLKGGFVFMIGTYGILEAIPTQRWLDRRAELDGYELNNPGRAALAMLTYNTSEPGQMLDKDGRIVVPVELREEGGLTVATGEKMDIRLVGTGEGIQIWPLSEYQLFKKLGTSYREDRSKQIVAAMKLMREFKD